MRAVAASVRFAVLSVLLASCGGKVEGAPIGSTAEPPATTASPSPFGGPEPPPSFPPPPSAPTAAPPSTLPPPSKIGDPPNLGDTPFHLVITNRSSQTPSLGVDVYIDGAHVITGGFSSGAPQTYDFAMAKGSHAVRVSSEAFSLRADQKYPVELTGEAWGLVDVTTIHCDPCAPPIVTWKLQDTPPPP